MLYRESGIQSLTGVPWSGIALCRISTSKAGIPPGKSDASGAEKPDVEVTMCLGSMPPDASDFPGGIPA